MDVQERQSSASKLQWSGYLLVGLGGIVPLGWLANIGPLTTVLPGQISMKANTGIGFLCAGLSLLMLARPSLKRMSRDLGMVFSTIVFAVGILTLVEYTFRIGLGIDQFHWTDPSQSPYPGAHGPHYRPQLLFGWV